MARVDVAVTGLFIEPRSGDPATGVVRFLLPQPIVSPLDGFTIEPVEVEAALDLTGRVDIVLSTVSGVNAVYVATVSITGADPRRFEFVVPASGDPIDLAAVQPIIPVLTDVPAQTTDSGPFLRPAANLSDVASAGAARTNLGLGSAATQPTSAFDAAGAATTAQTAERTRALAAEAVIVTSVTTEATRATAAEAALASSIAGSTVSDATATSKGIVQLAGDLAGTADAPTVPGLAAKADASALAAEASRAATAENQALRKTSNLSDLTNTATARSNLGLGSAATQAASAFDAAGSASAAQAASQPVDSDLTAIAALSTTSFGRSLLALADAAAGRSALALGSAATASVGDFDPAGVAAAVSTALAAETSRATAAEATAAQKSANLSDLASPATARTNLGLGSAATQPSSAFDAAGAAAAAQAASQPVDSDLTAIAALSTTTFGRSLLALLDAAAGRTAFGLGSAATQPSSAFDVAGAAAAAQAASLQRASNLADLASAPKARQNLGLATDPRAFGAIGDGTSRHLSTIYGSLAAAQAAFPTIADLALTDELDWAAIQHCVNVVTGSADPVTTTRYVTAPIHVYPGTYMCNRKVYVASALGFSFDGDGDSTIFRFLGTLVAGFEFNGISMSYVGNFAVKGKGDMSEDLTRAIWYHWDPATSSRTCYNNHFEDINVYELHYRTAWEVGELGNNGQVDTDLFVRCLAAGYSGPLVADSTYWRDGFAVGDGVFANNLLHTFIGCMTYGHHRGLAVRGTQCSWVGGQIQNNEIDVYTAVVSYCVVQGFRSEGSARLLETAGPAGYATHVSIRDVQWVPNELNTDTHFAVINTAGTVLFEQVNIAPWPSKTPTISAGQIGKLVIQFNGVSATTAPEALAGSWSSGAMLALRPYLQLDADGIPTQLVEQSEPDTLWFSDASQANRENGLHRTSAGDVGALQGLAASTAGPGGGVRMFDDGAGHLSPNGGSARPLFVDGWQMVILPRAVFYDFVDLVEFTTANMHFNDAAGHLRLGITTGSVEVAGTDLDVSTSGKGTILKSPAGNRFRVTVDDDGVIDTVAL